MPHWKPFRLQLKTSQETGLWGPRGEQVCPLSKDLIESGHMRQNESREKMGPEKEEEEVEEEEVVEEEEEEEVE